METSLAFPSSNARRDVSSSGLLSAMEPHHLCCSSSWTWSSHDMEEEQLISMVSLKAICWASASGVSTSFTTLSCEGWGGVGNFWSHGLDESWGDLSLWGQDPPLLVLWLCHSLVSHLLLDSLWDLPPCLVISDPCSSHSQVLLLGLLGEGSVVPCSHLGTCEYSSPLCLLFLILGPTFNPFKERSTDKCYVFANSIVWNLSPLVWAHHSAQEMGGV